MPKQAGGSQHPCFEPPKKQHESEVRKLRVRDSIYVKKKRLHHRSAARGSNGAAQALLEPPHLRLLDEVRDDKVPVAPGRDVRHVREPQLR